MENVKIKTEFITLGQLIKFLSLVGSGGEVKFFLSENIILVNGEIENRRGKKLFIDDIITINENRYRIVKK
ncbi:MAG: S4 domain-containing protein YaaA [Candidatus Izemoplasmatales bacterium]